MRALSSTLVGQTKLLSYRVAKTSGKNKPGFSKPCLCLSDTCHFRHCRCFRGCEERSPCFQWVECKFVIFAVFIKMAPFWQGTKTRLQLFCLHCNSWKLPAYSGACLLTVDNFSFFAHNWSFFLLTPSAFLLTSGAFLLTMGKFPGKCCQLQVKKTSPPKKNTVYQKHS